jgi:hypothetical protein
MTGSDAPLLGCPLLAGRVQACDCILIGGLGRLNSDELPSTRFDRAEGGLAGNASWCKVASRWPFSGCQ